jgi:predicted AlkP superfamily pyrophosphatase or phosphodiesterase
MMTKKTNLIRITTAVLLLASLAVSAERPRLIVFLSIDQMRADHLKRYASEYTGGFKRLLSEGVVYLNADLNYSNTSTGPGHATLSTGVYPWKSGIVGNSYIDRTNDRRTYSVEDSTAQKVDGDGGARSPKNLLVTTIGDWLKASSPESKIVSLSYKDRAAILLGGHKAKYAFWYDRNVGRMVTSSYYGTSIPAWAKSFNESGWIKKNVPPVWTKLKDEAVYAKYGPDELEGEEVWNGSTSFPHRLEENKVVNRFFSTPWGNTYLLDFARAALKGENLGSGNVTDLLCISLSTTDAIGSESGPNSHEMIDNLLRLDLDLGSFLADLESAFGKGNVLFVLGGDHGVMQLPEYLSGVQHVAARRFSNRTLAERSGRTLDSLMRVEYGINEWIVKGTLINYAAVKSASLNPAVIEGRIRETLMKIDGIADVVFRSELLDKNTPQRPYLEAFRHSFLSERSPDIFIRDCENCLVTDAKTGTSHGSPYMYDRIVPIVFWGSGKASQRIERSVHTVDIAATLAAIFNLPAPKTLDGVPLKEVTR